MKIYNVGVDELSEYDYNELPKDLVWFVYRYEYGYYDGSGEAVGMNSEGKLLVGNLGHCSCYGPCEGMGQGQYITVEEFLRKKESIHDYDCSDSVKAKVLELLGGQLQ